MNTEVAHQSEGDRVSLEWRSQPIEQKGSIVMYFVLKM